MYTCTNMSSWYPCCHFVNYGGQIVESHNKTEFSHYRLIFFFFLSDLLAEKKLSGDRKMHEWHLVWRREMEQRQWDQIFISQGLYNILIHIPVCSFTLCPLQLHNLLPILIIFVWVCLCLPFSLQGELQLRKYAVLIEFFCDLSLTHETFGRYQNTLRTTLKKTSKFAGV